MKREYKISLSQQYYSDIVYLSQYDTDYPIIFKVVDKYAATSEINGLNAKFTGTRNDGLGFTFESIAVGGTVSFEINTSLTAVSGMHTGEIVFTDAEGLYYGSANVKIVVEAAARPDGTIDADVERAQEIVEQIQEIVDNAAATVSGEAEKWATGQVDGTDVPSTDPAYENNAKYYAEQAETAAASIGIDATLTQAGKAADAKVVGDEISGVKEDLNSKITNPSAGTQGQILTNDGQGGAVWSNVGTPTDAQVGEAVETWLEDHPEATTTVEDGSLTVAKFTESTQAQVLNDYATPEMFGAVGDGTTDDTTAINNMFASSYTRFVFSNKTYLITAPITVSNTCVIDCKVTSIKTTIDIDYMLHITASNVVTKGRINLLGQNCALIGLYLDNASGHYIDYIHVESVLIWGIYSTHSITANIIDMYQCGIMITAKAKYLEAKTFAITDITATRYTDKSDATRIKIFDNTWKQNKYLIDDSGYSESKGGMNRIAFKSNESTPMTLAEGDTTSGTYYAPKVGYALVAPSDYADGDDGRSVFIPLGGGVCANGGMSRINNFYCQVSPVMFMQCNTAYVLHIGYLGSHLNTIPLIIDGFAYKGFIGAFYSESAGNGFAYSTHKNIDIIAQDQANSNITVGSAFNNDPSICSFTFDNEIILNIGIVNSKPNYETSLIEALNANGVVNKLNAVNANKIRTNVTETIDEFSTRNRTVYSSTGYNATRAIFALDLKDTNDSGKNGFEPFVLWYRSDTLTDSAKYLRFTLSTNLINAGYTINGAVDNVIAVDTSTYNGNCKITVILFDKTFYVTAEALTYVDNTTT